MLFFLEKRAVARVLVAAGLFWMSAAAQADCALPRAADRVDGAAKLLLATYDLVGVATVSQRQDIASNRPETLQFIVTFKGRPSSVTLNLPVREGDAIVITNNKTATGLKEGAAVLVALNLSSSRPTISECSVQIISRFSTADLLGSLLRHGSLELRN